MQQELSLHDKTITIKRIQRLKTRSESEKEVVRLLEDQFTHYGFVPIDTPALEYTDVLLGKGGGETDKQFFILSIMA